MCVILQAAVFKWWGHAWSFHPRDDVAIMQAVVPVASGLSHMKYELPAQIVPRPDAPRKQPITKHVDEL